MSAAAPIFREKLSDVDCRWDVISGSVDDRTDEEKGLTVRLTIIMITSSVAYCCLVLFCFFAAEEERAFHYSEIAIWLGRLLHFSSWRRL